MVKPNAVGNSSSAAEGANNPWNELGNLKMGAVATAGEKIQNKKFALASKFEAWRANNAKNKADKKLKDAADYSSELRKEVKAQQKETNGLHDKVENQNNIVQEKQENLDYATGDYADKKKEASVGNYAKNQAKQVAELFKAGGSVLRSGVRAFWQNSKSLKIKAGDIVAAGSVEKATSDKAKVFEKASLDANKAKVDARAKWAEVLGGFGKNKETHKSNIEAKKAAKLELEDAKKTLATETSKLSEYSSAYEQSNKAYEKISEAYEAAKEKKDKAFEKYDAARTRLKEAKDNVALAESIMDLRVQLGRTDVKKVREGLEKKRAELKEKQEVFQAKADKMAKALGIDPADENLPEDKLKQYNDLIEAAFGDEGSSIINQYSVLNKQEEAIKDYEEAKTKQVEKIAENKTAKSGISAFIGGVVARFKIPDFFGNEEDEDELNVAA